MAGWTNRGKFKVLDCYLRNAALPTNFYVFLLTAAPTAATNTVSQLSQIAAGNGYATTGLQLNRNGTDFPTAAPEDDTNNLAAFQTKDLVWNASGGPIPASGGLATYAAIADGNTGSDNVLFYWDIRDQAGTGRQVSDGQPFTLRNSDIRLTEN